ncbi:hypothetical protein EDC01DRAFT_627302 [Geopyxis carbonaria]|nr:hypothetical protein EDC01DRAFT_627302 [Geopyxis carbonaria]
MSGFPRPTPLAEAAAPPSPSTSPARRMSLTESFLNARPPLGALAATGEVFGRGPNLVDLRRDSAGSVPTTRTRRGSSLSGASAVGSPGSRGLCVDSPVIMERRSEDNRRYEHDPMDGANGMMDTNGVSNGVSNGTNGTEKALNGRASGEETVSDRGHETQPHWWAVTKTGLAAFWKWFTTPFGFVLTIYMLNVVAWGGMLFLLLCNASPAMCKPSCNDINSPRRIWIEIDSQILNSLFCVTGFGLIPWRFRDLYHLLRWRLFSRTADYTKLQEIHSNWYRAPDPLPSAEEPITGERAPTTKSWKLDYVIWLYVWNTFFQVILSTFMWHYNRIERPSWSTGLFVALACGVAGMAGGQVWWESRKVKQIEGEKPKDEVAEEEARGRQS